MSKTLADEIELMIKDLANNNPAPVRAIVTDVYPDDHVDIRLDGFNSDIKYRPLVCGVAEVGADCVVIFLNGNMNDSVVICPSLFEEVDLSPYYSSEEVDELLNTKSDKGHMHDDRYFTKTIINTELEKKANKKHQHDDIYYLKDEINNKLKNKSDLNHNHNTVYYLKSEVNTALNTKSDKNHQHNNLYYDKDEVNTKFNNYYLKTDVDSRLSGKAEKNHDHDDAYYSKSEVNDRLLNKADLVHNHDDLYYRTENIDKKMSTRKLNPIELGQIIRLLPRNNQGDISCSALFPELTCNPEVINSGETASLTVNVKDFNNFNVPNVKVQLYKDGVSMGSEYSNITNHDGETIFNYTSSDEGVFRINGVISADSNYEYSSTETRKLFVKSSNNLLPVNVWSGGDYSNNIDGMFIVNDVTCDVSSDWSLIGDKSFKIVKSNTDRGSWVEARISDGISTGDTVKAQITVNKVLEDWDLRILDVDMDYDFTYSRINIPSSNTPQTIELSHTISKTNLKYVALRLVRYAPNGQIFADNLKLFKV